MRTALALFLTVSLLTPATGQTPARLTLSVDEIMRGPGLYGYAPRQVRWSGDGQRVYFQWKEASSPVEKDYDLWVANRDGSGLRKLSEDEVRLAPPLGGHYTRDRLRVAYADRGDLFIYDLAALTRRQLTKTAEAESAPRFTRDERGVTFTRAGNLYRLTLETGLLEQLTDIRPAGGPPQAGAAAERKGTDSQESLKKDERGLLEIIEQRAKRREEDEARRKKDNPRKPFQLTGRQNVTQLTLAPAGDYVLATVGDQAEGARQSVVPNYVTESAYTETIPSRTKVGENQSRSRWALLGVETGEVTWVDPGLKDKPPAEGKEAPPRALTLANPVWNEEGTRLAALAYSADNKDRWVLAVDAATGKCRVITNDHDEAWVGGPGNFTLGFLADGATLYFQSERTGWSHLYTVSFDGGEPVALTSGRWEVDSAVLSRDKQTFYLTTNEVSPAEQHIYSMPATGGARTRLTAEPGMHQAVFTADGSAFADIHSYSNRPPELFLRGAGGARPVQVTRSPAPEFSTYAWIDPPIVEIPARDGARVPARIYKPKTWKQGGPAVFFVHGAGYLQNVHRGWSSYAREYMFHHLLMERGYLVADIDYRASAGYGRDWRTGVYRHMGGKDLDDHVDAARWLVKEHGVAASKIGIYGGSYGGFITLMAMFTQPDVFTAGAALRPVTDWAHYNHGYTSDILNVPQKDREAYRRSSPIFHAAGLKGALLICHGMVDVNVHFQDSVRLAQKLIELRKENWELAVYPVEDHGFTQPSSWADEYKRILKLFERNLR
jgi:dipeptidyl aminopeptidase/acylaminoacyl peptidase